MVSSSSGKLEKNEKNKTKIEEILKFFLWFLQKRR